MWSWKYPAAVSKLRSSFEFCRKEGRTLLSEMLPSGVLLTPGTYGVEGGRRKDCTHEAAEYRGSAEDN